MNPLVQQALEKALVAHHGQFRKISKIPYVVHCIRVWQLVLENQGSLYAQAAGLLHDVCEDTTYTITEFPHEVQSLVDWLTQRPDQSKQAYLERLAEGPTEAVLIKICDRLDNVLDRQKLPPASGSKYLVKSKWSIEAILKMGQQHNLTDRPAYQQLAELFHKL